MKGARTDSPVLLTGPHYESQRAAPPRASAAEAVPAGSGSSQRPRRSLTPTGRGSWPPARGPPTVLALDPGRRPAVLPIEEGGEEGPSYYRSSRFRALDSPRSPHWVLSFGQSDFNWGKLSWGLCPLPFLKYRDRCSLKVIGWNLIRALSARNFFEVENRTPEK